MRCLLLVFSLLMGLGSFAGEWTNPHFQNRAILAAGYAANALDYKAKVEAEIKKNQDAAKRSKAMAVISHAFLTYCSDRKVTCPKDREKVYEFQTNMCSIALEEARKTVTNILKGVRAGAMTVQNLDLKNEGCSLGEAAENTGGLNKPTLKPAPTGDMLKKAEEVKPGQN